MKDQRERAGVRARFDACMYCDQVCLAKSSGDGGGGRVAELDEIQ